MTTFSLAFRFRAVRERRNLAQQRLADKANVARNTVSNLENKGDVKLSTLLALSEALNVPAHTWLIADKEWFEWFCYEYAQEVTTLAWVRLNDLPPGMVFVTQNGALAVKSEYKYNGEFNSQWRCILLGSGEYAHFADGNDTMVSAIEVTV